MSYCTEHEILPERELPEPRKRKRRVANKVAKLEWPKIASKHVRVFILPWDSTEATIWDFPKTEHLERLRGICQSDNINSYVIGPILNKKGEPSGSELVAYYAEDGLHTEKKPNAYLNKHLSPLGVLDLLGNVILAAQSAKTGNPVSVKSSDLAKLPAVLRANEATRAILRAEVEEAGGVIVE